jgi:hypothetical protein
MLLHGLCRHTPSFVELPSSLREPETYIIIQDVPK